MHFSRYVFVLVSFLSVASAQLDLELIISKLPGCSISCSEQLLPEAGCAFADIRNCLCTNTTLQFELASCIQASCNATEQFASMAVSQNLMCNGVPKPSRSREITRIVVAITSVTFVIVILRVLSRWHTAHLWWDDWTILASAVIMIPMTAIPIYNAERGFGQHVWDVPPENIPSMQELYYVSQILYAIVLNLVKVSILFLFLRIFPTDRFRLFTKICLVWMACQTVAFFFAVTLQCVPINSIWDASLKRKCINSTAMIYSGAICSIFEDICIILLPVWELKALNLSLTQRVGVMFMFTFGSFSCVTSMVRLKYIVDYSFQYLDATWVSTDVVIWSILEVYTAIICASLIAIRPLLVKHMPSIFHSTVTSKSPPRWEPKSGSNSWGRGNISTVIEQRSTISANSADSAKVWTDVWSGGEKLP